MLSSTPHAKALLTEQREAIERVVEERFTKLAAYIEDEFRAAGDRARRESAEAFNRAARRLQRCENEEQWAAAVLDSSAVFAAKSMLFAASREELKPLRAPGTRPAPLGDAPALASAIQSRETTIALVSAAELSDPVAAAFAGDERCAVVPIISRERSVAVLIAAGKPLDVNGLEAVAALAGPALERARVPRPDYNEDAIHARAQRFARVRAAEMRLYKSGAVETGRSAKRIYTELKEEIDSARDTFEREYLSKAPAMPDYLHGELVRTLANHDVLLLGEDYPGPLA